MTFDQAFEHAQNDYRISKQSWNGESYLFVKNSCIYIRYIKIGVSRRWMPELQELFDQDWYVSDVRCQKVDVPVSKEYPKLRDFLSFVKVS
ncbi:MAG: hypothetical protein WC942_04510 [Clostridia bacterium]|jgi:hypothetical protein